MDTKELRPGDRVYTWHDSGAWGVDPVRLEVVRVNRKTVTVQHVATGVVARIDPDRIVGRITPDEDANW